MKGTAELHVGIRCRGLCGALFCGKLAIFGVGVSRLDFLVTLRFVSPGVGQLFLGVGLRGLEVGDVHLCDGNGILLLLILAVPPTDNTIKT